jgi:hypothetical protein
VPPYCEALSFIDVPEGRVYRASADDEDPLAWLDCAAVDRVAADAERLDQRDRRFAACPSQGVGHAPPISGSRTSGSPQPGSGQRGTAARRTGDLGEVNGVELVHRCVEGFAETCHGFGVGTGAAVWPRRSRRGHGRDEVPPSTWTPITLIAMQQLVLPALHATQVPQCR